MLSLKKQYFFIFLLLCFSILLGYFVSSHIVKSNYEYGNIINLAGKQRMLSQKIQIELFEYNNTPNQTNKEKLLQSLQTFEQTHTFLCTKTFNETLHQLYFSKGGLEEVVTKYIASFYQFLEKNDPKMVINITRDGELVLTKIDTIVSEYEKYSLQEMQKIEYYLIFICLFIFLILFLSWVFILKPNALKLDKLLHKNKNYIQLIDHNIITSSTDLKGNITYVSEAFCAISGYTKRELLGKNHRIIRHPDMPDAIYATMWETIEQNKTWEGEVKNLDKNGGFYWVQASISPIFDESGEKIGYTAIRQDITDKKRIEEISITDGLTNIFNRRYFNAIFPKIINSAKRDKELVCFLLLDIDHFKQYNDNYGHQAGDDVLIQFAQCLKKSLHRADDLAFRLGGEEFGVVYKADTKEKAFEFANRLRQNIHNLHITHQFTSVESKIITASMGLVCEDGESIGDIDTVYKEADRFLYQAKENGRDRVSSMNKGEN